jgi:hypothetical protein
MFIPLLAIGVGLLAYHNSLHHCPFIFDDALYIVENPRIRHLWHPELALNHRLSCAGFHGIRTPSVIPQSCSTDQT